MNLARYRATWLTVVLALGAPAFGCTIDEHAFPEAVLRAALKVSDEAQRNALLTSLVEESLPADVKANPAKDALVSTILRLSLGVAKGDATVLSKELRNRAAGLCNLLSTGDASSAGATVAQPSPAPALGSPLAANISTKAEADDQIKVLENVSRKMDLFVRKNGDTNRKKELAKLCGLSDTLDSYEEFIPQCVETARDTYTKIDAVSDLAKERKDAAAKAIAVIDGTEARLNPRAGVYIGPRYTLKSDGGWASGAEALAEFESSQVHDSRWCLGATACSGYTDIGYFKRESAKDEQAGDLNPFATTGGVLRANFAGKFRYSDWVGFTGGVGITSPFDNRPNTSTSLKPRVFFGPEYQTIYSTNDGKTLGFGSVMLGLAYDQFWNVCDTRDAPAAGQELGACTHNTHSYKRYIVDGRFLVPGTDLGSVKLAARFYVDGPISGPGESDIGVSIMVFKDFNSWLDTTAGKK